MRNRRQQCDVNAKKSKAILDCMNRSRVLRTGKQKSPSSPCWKTVVISDKLQGHKDTETQPEQRQKSGRKIYSRGRMEDIYPRKVKDFRKKGEKKNTRAIFKYFKGNRINNLMDWKV